MDSRDRGKQHAAPPQKQSTAQHKKPRASDQKNVQKQRPAPHARPRRRPQPQAKPVEDVVYLPPKPFNRNRILLRLLTVTAIVVAIFLASSVFFKVGEGKILVSGTNKYTAWDICQASGIQKGDNLLTFGRSKAVGKIKAALPYVENVRIGITLPDTVNIEITEVAVTYAAKDQNESWWLLSSDGKVVDKAAGSENKHTKILGVQIANPKVGYQAVAWENAQTGTDADGNPVPVTESAAEKLKTALSIADYLEMNGIIGNAASIDVTNLSNIQLWYGQRYQVKLGDNSQLSYKISYMKGVIQQMDSHQSGILDITFTTDPNGVPYTPFH